MEYIRQESFTYLKFYLPKYDIDIDNYRNNEPRTVFWNPNVTIGKEGRYILSYPYNQKGNYKIFVEGIDNNGRIGKIMETL